jgi:hypothetical protein
MNDSEFCTLGSQIIFQVQLSPHHLILGDLRRCDNIDRIVVDHGKVVNAQQNMRSKEPYNIQRIYNIIEPWLFLVFKPCATNYSSVWVAPSSPTSYTSPFQMRQVRSRASLGRNFLDERPSCS